MAISHANHSHPNTPAARAACRKALNDGNEVATTSGTFVGKPAQMTVVPRRKGDGGVVQGMKAAKPIRGKDAGVRGEVRIRTAGDFPGDIPAGHTLTIARAWEKGWSVILGESLTTGETRILIGGNGVQVSLVWNAEGSSGVFVRTHMSSIQHRVDSGIQAIALAAGDEEWPWVNHGKAV